ncbi:MAG: hypothetical protein QOI44_286 [Actinomycetota bacterium]|nr:hypothetical protein [Actinomycetota bacterium]
MGVLSRWRRQSNPALSRAEQLAGDGRWLEAMTILGEANRAHPDAALETELVHIRHRAFAALDRTAGPDALPLVDDPFPDVYDVPPEITPALLDAGTLRGAVQHHGSLLVRGLIPEAEVARLRDDIDCAFAANEAHSLAPAPDAGPWFAPLTGDGIDDGVLDFDRAIAIAQGGLLAADSPRALFDVLDLYRRLGILAVLTEYFGEHPTLSARKTTLRKVHADKFFEALDGRGADAGWHQDGAFLGAGVRTMNLWVALSECGRDAPSLDLVARRVDRILPTGTAGAAFDWAASSAVVDDVGAGAIVRPDFAPGDALFFDGFLVHQTGADPAMTQTRYAIESWFFAPSTYPLEWIPLVS